MFIFYLVDPEYRVIAVASHICVIERVQEYPLIKVSFLCRFRGHEKICLPERIKFGLVFRLALLMN
jgi:hypothetical protein